MKEIKEEAKRHHEAKLRKYGADHKACGGKMKAYAHGGHVEHDDEKEDKTLIKKEVKGECLKHRADGGLIAGGPSGKLGRGRKGGKGKGTNVNIAIAPKGPDAAGAPSMPPPALGSGPSAAPPRPIVPPAAAAAMPPRPGMPPMKHGGHVKKHHEHEKSHKAEHHSKRHHRTQHH